MSLNLADLFESLVDVIPDRLATVCGDRRLTYAGKHFATASGAPGWQTDRGHIYIIYGPPDEIDSHPKESHPYAVELWRYRYLEGIGSNSTITFVDKTGKGDYHAAPGTGSYTP